MNEELMNKKQNIFQEEIRDTIAVTLLLLTFFSTVQAQNASVGIDVANPDPSAVLDLDDSGNQRGLLVPRMNATERLAIASPADGLFVYDSDQKMFYHYDAGLAKWQGVNPFSYRKGDTPADEDHFVIAFTDFPSTKSFVIGEVASPTARLEVDEDIKGAGDLSVTDISAATITSTGNISVGAAGVLQGKGTVPLGGIVIWSGNASTVPPGWALCNGETTAGFKTPDLSARFIVGFDDAGVPNAYTQPGDLSTNGTTEGNVGGNESIVLTINQMPAHSHTATASSDGSHNHSVGTRGYLTDIDGAGADYADGADGSFDDTGVSTQSSGGHSHSITVQNAGGGQAHENRPPYYVLAFIMRVE
jgi:microcystin-dependent protein